MKKKVIIFFVVLFLLLFIGASGFWFWNKVSNSPGKCLLTTFGNCNKLIKNQVDTPVKATRLEFNSTGSDKIFAPISGKCKKATIIYDGVGKDYEYIEITGQIDKKEGMVNFVFNSGLTCLSENIKAGTLLGYIKKSPMPDYNNHDLVVMVLSKKTVDDYSYYENDEQLLTKLIK